MVNEEGIGIYQFNESQKSWFNHLKRKTYKKESILEQNQPCIQLPLKMVLFIDAQNHIQNNIWIITFGHSGPVYKVRCNPFFGDIFLTCSADWSCKLWNWTEGSYPKPISNNKTYKTKCQTLNGLLTLLYYSHQFARMVDWKLWDLTKNNMLDPYFTIMPQDQQIWPAKTMVRFAHNSPVLITGDARGDINAYRLYGYEDNDPLQEEEKLRKLLYPSGYSKGQKEQKD
ncbi:unnamed protein product (macronuclear) [Paramecium tetraurelia]|uniref:Dynein axonemal intermediate chain 4 n=1 Tax=Paramecium tetraurelia TaxID=5888 RepID=A0DWB5_PARTE|nr:uncharacterized protein GSPATT00020974001 [Paramecium tetraurelia]CAK87332.1 unnamed protein product [Paramecium tetraurelia]|eukprot:XP_001454729.1 hypothetical protein (macronuclear) [Paramecium tetraurelia strain d4-2]